MSPFAGAGELLRLALRRSRLLVAAWLAVFVGMAALSAEATVDLYPTLASRLEAAETLNRSQALVALYGRVYDPSSLGAIAMIKMGGFGSVFVAVLAVVLAVRHTRGDEEAGRTELVGGTATGRLAPLAAAFATVAVTNAALAVLTAGGLVATGLPLDGSIAFGLAWAGVGLAFGAIAGLLAQLTPSARTATALSTAVLGAVYLLRAVGDAADEHGPRWMSWLSPIGWGQQFRPFAGNRWWVLGITLGFTALVGATAFAVAERRDLGTGLLPPRPGPAHGPPTLGGPLALAWRLHRGALLGWAIGFGLMGALLGSLASDVSGFVTSPEAREFFEKLGGEQALSDAYLAVELSFAGITAAAYGMHVVMRLRVEEAAGRAEPVLATAVGRVRWVGSHLLIALAGTTILLGLAGLGAGVAYGLSSGDPGKAVPVLVGALVQLPAAWVLVAVVVALFGLAPRHTTAAWAVLAGFVLLAEVGPLLELDQRLLDLSPFAHVPRIPGDDLTATPLVALLTVAAALAALGLATFRRRDVA